MKKKVVPKLRQEVKLKVDIVTSDNIKFYYTGKFKLVPKFRQVVKLKVDIVTSGDIKFYYTGKFKDFTARYIINTCILPYY